MMDFARWYEGKDFSFDWTSGNLDVWANVLAALRDRSCDVLEIGSWEGRSAQKTGYTTIDSATLHVARTPRNLLRLLRGELTSELCDFWADGGRAPA